MERSKIVAISLAAFFAICFALLLTLSIVYYLRYNKYYYASSSAIDNDIFCKYSEEKCTPQISDQLKKPSELKKNYDNETAKYCADLVARIEICFKANNDFSQHNLPPNLKLCKNLYYKDNVIGFVAICSASRIVWVVFRGTASKEEWKQDFNFTQRDLTFSGPEAQKQLSVRTGEIFTCHEGFLKIYQDLKKKLTEAVDGQQMKKVIVTGHSLGASLATLASIDLSSESYEVSTYVFGSPRVCEYVPSTMFKSFWRINNTTDVITNVPLSVMPNIHKKEIPFAYTHVGKSKEFTKNRLSLTNNHLMAVYIQALQEGLT
jgi:predicted lipase